ncbi:MAG: SDR family oxidoreductase, partial [Gammaproteobacteria bacterium]
GHPQDVANAVVFLVRDSDYISGQVITVDGGRSVCL